MQTVSFAISAPTGQALLMHNERLANPMDPIVKTMKTVTSKKKKTDEDHAYLAELEFKGGLYHNDDVGPYIPATYLEATIFAAGKLNKRGQDVKRGLQVVDDAIALDYKGPRDIPSLWKKGFYDQRMVKVQSSRTLRTRPKFAEWKATFTVAFDDEIFNRDDVVALVETAGRLVGIGDYRPRFGRFNVEVTN